MNEKILQIIINTAKKIAPKFKFGYYDTEDIMQECIIVGLEAYSRYDSKLAALETFLYHHMINRLKNLKRAKYRRKCQYCEHGCEKCLKLNEYNKTKMNLINTISLESVDKAISEKNMSYDNNIIDELHVNEIEARINEVLPKDLRIDYLRMLDGVYISPIKREKIESIILEIYEEFK